LHWFENQACGPSVAKRSITVSLAKVAEITRPEQAPLFTFSTVRMMNLYNSSP